MAKQTLKQAIHIATTGKSRELRSAANALDGKPVGSWPETQQARREVRELLPLESQRGYTVSDFVEAAYKLDSADRYRSAI